MRLHEFRFIGRLGDAEVLVGELGQANGAVRKGVDGTNGELDAYLGFLKGGSSKWPLDLLRDAGVDMQHVPMKSTGDAVNEVLAGRVQGVTSSLIGITAFKADPRVKILAYTGTQRSRFMPELPTVAEARALDPRGVSRADSFQSFDLGRCSCR